MPRSAGLALGDEMKRVVRNGDLATARRSAAAIGCLCDGLPEETRILTLAMALRCVAGAETERYLTMVAAVLLASERLDVH